VFGELDVYEWVEGVGGCVECDDVGVVDVIGFGECVCGVDVVIVLYEVGDVCVVE